MTTPSLDELLKIAEAATPGGYEAPNEWAVFTYTFHPTVAKALVKVAMAAAALKFSAYPAHSVGFVTIVHAGNINVLEEALADLAAALKEGK